MNKKIILGLCTSALLASSLFAFSCQGDMRKSCDQKSGHYQKEDRIMKMVMMLDLSDKQQIQVKQIIQENMKNSSNPYSAFSDTDFDKAKFIKLSNEKRDLMIEKRADVISKIYAVLDSSQRKELKTILDMKEIRKNKMMKEKLKQKGGCNDKNCNGRG